MHLPIRVWKNGVYTDLRLFNNVQNQVFTIADSRVDSIQFDPDKWLCAVTDRVVSAPELKQVQAFKIIPDFANQSIQIVFPEFTGNETYEVFDVTGRSFSKGELRSDRTIIHTAQLKTGVYLIVLEANHQKNIAKFVIP
jgi:hypothetical protein